MTHSRVRPPPEEDLQSAVHEEIRKPIADQHPAAAPPVGKSDHTPEPARTDYFNGAYAGTGAVKPSPELSLHELLARFQLPESLGGCIVRLMAIARSHGVAEALVAAGKDPALDSQHRSHARQLLSFVFQADHKPRG